MWRREQVHLYKRKGNRQLCDNHRGISPLNIAGKMFVRILLNRLQGHSEDFPEASTDQPGQLTRRRTRPADLEEDGEDRRSDLRSQPNH
ncbi:hypothetical protein SprV_0401551300 [Sparganum proliferum]